MLDVDIRIALPEFSLHACFNAPNGITAICGPSGSGKTTLINALAGTVRPDQGHIRMDGAVFFCADSEICVPTEKRRIGYIFQDARLFPHMTVAQNLMVGRRFQHLPNDPALFHEIVQMLGIGSLLSRRPSRLSGGEKQRVAIGRALLAEPQLILADEPLSSLDAARKDEILPYFETLRDQKALPIVYVSHQPDELKRLANTTLTLDQGVLGQESN